MVMFENPWCKQLIPQIGDFVADFEPCREDFEPTRLKEGEKMPMFSPFLWSLYFFMGIQSLYFINDAHINACLYLYAYSMSIVYKCWTFEFDPITRIYG